MIWCIGCVISVEIKNVVGWIVVVGKKMSQFELKCVDCEKIGREARWNGNWYSKNRPRIKFCFMRLDSGYVIKASKISYMI